MRRLDMNVTALWELENDGSRELGVAVEEGVRTPYSWRSPPETDGSFLLRSSDTEGSGALSPTCAHRRHARRVHTAAPGMLLTALVCALALSLGGVKGVSGGNIAPILSALKFKGSIASSYLIYQQQDNLALSVAASEGRNTTVFLPTGTQPSLPSVSTSHPFSPCL